MPKSKSPQIELSIIIVSYNTAALTIQTIESTLEACAQKNHPLNAEIIVIDNDSQDTSVIDIERIAKQSKKIPVTLIKNKTNTGFATANNQGMKIAKGKYVLLLNSDTIVSKNALISIVEAFDQNPIDNTTSDLSSYHGKLDKLGIQAATLLNPNKTPQPQGGSFPTLFSLFTHMSMLDDLPLIGWLLPSTQHTGKRSEIPNLLQSSNQLQQKEWVAGTALAIRKVVVERIGMLDEKIFMYGEDIEYCIRAKNHHWDIAENLGSVIIHMGNASGSSKRAIVGELTGYLYIWSKHKPYWQYPLVKAMILFGCHARVLLFGTILGNQIKKEIYQHALEEIKKYE